VRGALGIAQRPAPLRPRSAAIGEFGRCEVAQGTMRPGVCSGRLSDTHIAGQPRQAMMTSSSRTTRKPGSEVSATSARHSRVKSSTTARIQKRRPSANASDRPSTQAEYRRSVELFLDPFFAKQRVRSVTTADVAELHGSLSHIPYQANRTLGVLSKMMNLAETWGMRDRGTNPCEDIERYPEHRRESKRRGISTVFAASILSVPACHAAMEN
jgi:hypothetical protein